MESHSVLSDAEEAYIRSQSKEAIPKGNNSEYRKRIRRKVKLAFDDFDKIYNSKVLTQSYKDKVFDMKTISSFLGHFTYYDKNSTTISEELMKQEIATRLIDMGVSYFRQRFPSTFAVSHINDAFNLLREIADLSSQQVADERALEFYKMRGKMMLPPLLQSLPADWYALCMVCWKYSSGKELGGAASSLRHAKMCPVDKKRLEQCLKFIPPEGLCSTREEKRKDRN